MCLLLTALSAFAIHWHFTRGYVLYYGDAQAHLVNARRMIDSRTPGPEQIGTVWLPLPHVLMLPFARMDEWWRSGLAGAIPSGGCYVLAGVFLYAAVRRLLSSRAVAAAAVGLFALNPNLLYLQSAPMTEPVFLACLMALFYAMAWFRQTNSIFAVVLAAVASNGASLTRYEGWFLIPFVALFFAVSKRWWLGLLFGTLASLSPLAWLAHDWWYSGDMLAFYHGPYSAKAYYQRALDGGMDRYPGDQEWRKAWLQFRTAAELCAGRALVILGLSGLAGAIWKRQFWPVGFLALPVAFYVWSIYSSGTPIFVPGLWPYSYYNTRYGLAAFPLLVFSAATLVAVVPDRFKALTAVLVVATAVMPWTAYPHADSWICWKESQVNSEARRAWTREAAEYLKANYRTGDGIVSNLGDLAGIYREAGIPLKEVLHEGNNPHWLAANARPDLFLWEHWAVAISGDAVSTALTKSEKYGRPYACVKMITVKGAPVIGIYRRQSASNANTVHQGAWRPQ
ncbi:MAG TPA: glycosyltransferase family 39 protein [Bryobacteraceae bacterium]|nr:glycosyltransferase family 39 protein [Bryobacteraceae bacterium]